MQSGYPLFSRCGERLAFPPDSTSRRPGFPIKFSRYVNWHTGFNCGRSDNAAPVEGSAMTESTKRRVTGDLMILAVGAAILIVLAFVGAL